MKKILTLIVFLFLLAVLGYYFVDLYAERFQSTLKSNVQKELNKNGFNNVEVLVDGRDVKLTGALKDNSQIAKLTSIAESVIGVRSVNNFVKANKPATMPPAPAPEPEPKQAEKIAPPKIEEVVNVDVVGIKKIEQTEEMKQVAAPEVKYVPAEPPLEKVEEKIEEKETKVELADNKKALELEKAKLDEKLKEEKLRKQKEAEELAAAEAKARELAKIEKLKKQEELQRKLAMEKAEKQKLEAERQAQKEQAQKKANEANKFSADKVQLKPEKLEIVKSSSSKSIEECRANIENIISRTPVIFRPGTQYIEYRTGNVLTEIAKSLRLCPKAKLVVVGHGFDSLAQDRADTIALLLRDIEQVPQKVTVSIIKEAPVSGSVTFEILK